MGGAVKVSVDIDLLKYIKVTLEEAADDISAYLDREYPEDLREKYTTYERRYKNAMEVVMNARWCHDQLEKALNPIPNQ